MRRTTTRISDDNKLVILKDHSFCFPEVREPNEVVCLGRNTENNRTFDPAISMTPKFMSTSPCGANSERLQLAGENWDRKIERYMNGKIHGCNHISPFSCLSEINTTVTASRQPEEWSKKNNEEQQEDADLELALRLSRIAQQRNQQNFDAEIELAITNLKQTISKSRTDSVPPLEKTTRTAYRSRKENKDFTFSCCAVREPSEVVCLRRDPNDSTGIYPAGLTTLKSNSIAPCHENLVGTRCGKQTTRCTTDRLSGYRNGSSFVSKSEQHRTLMTPLQCQESIQTNQEEKEDADLKLALALSKFSQSISPAQRDSEIELEKLAGTTTSKDNNYLSVSSCQAREPNLVVCASQNASNCTAVNPAGSKTLVSKSALLLDKKKTNENLGFVGRENSHEKIEYRTCTMPGEKKSASNTGIITTPRQPRQQSRANQEVADLKLALKLSRMYQ